MSNTGGGSEATIEDTVRQIRSILFPIADIFTWAVGFTKHGQHHPTESLEEELSRCESLSLQKLKHLQEWIDASSAEQTF